MTAGYPWSYDTLAYTTPDTRSTVNPLRVLHRLLALRIGQNSEHCCILFLKLFALFACINMTYLWMYFQTVTADRNSASRWIRWPVSGSHYRCFFTGLSPVTGHTQLLSFVRAFVYHASRDIRTENHHARLSLGTNHDPETWSGQKNQYRRCVCISFVPTSHRYHNQVIVRE